VAVLLLLLLLLLVWGATCHASGRKRIGGIITAVSSSSKGPLDKSTLASEWQQLASEIAAVEAAEQSKGRSSSAGGSGSSKRPPWKKQQ